MPALPGKAPPASLVRGALAKARALIADSSLRIPELTRYREHLTLRSLH